MKLAKFINTPRRRATELEVAAVLFESILGRRATEADLRAAASGLASAKGLRNQINAMVRSEEFAIMRTPHLLAEAAKNYQGEKVFFLHVPKTAGTSLRHAFIDAMGIPALDRYARVGRWDGYSEAFIKMWPLLVGHTNVKSFPDGGHRGVTVFREPRARVLSTFRQSTRSIVATPIHINTDTSKKMRERAAVWLADFPSWLKTEMHPLDLLTWHVIMNDDNNLPSSGEAGIRRVDQSRFLERVSATEIRQALERGLRRISVAEWQHNREGISKLVERTLERTVAAPVNNANQVLPEQVMNPIQLSKGDHARLTEIASQSQIVFEVAEDQGLIKNLTRDEADEQFEIAARRLGFKV